MTNNGWRFRFSLTHVGLIFLIAAAWMLWQSQPESSQPVKTDRALDIAFFGRGWIEVINASGKTLYTRDGRLSINADGTLVAGRVQDGFTVEPSICIPQGWRTLSFSPQGEVTAVLPNSPETMTLGMLQIASFNNPEGLLEVLPGFYVETDESGPACISNAGEGGTGYIKQGWALQADVPEPLTFASLTSILAVCLSGWTLHEVRRLRQNLHAS